MSTTVKITTVGNSAGIVLPKEILVKMRVEKGDTLYLVETPNGIQITPYRPDFAGKIEAAQRVMRKNRDALRRLAK